jgi:CRISP-associated protein Cas1
MLNEFTYCPRLFFLEWVNGEFVDNAFTVEGQTIHRRVDRKEAGGLPSGEFERPFQTRSIEVNSETLGLSGKIDVVEGTTDHLVPADSKRGRPHLDPLEAWEPDQVQLCAYALLLREAGYTVNEAVVYYAATKQRVSIAIDEALIARTLEAVKTARAIASSGVIPPPLKRSPKCGGCSLNAICLPDEVNALADEKETTKPRNLVPSRDDQAPFYVQGQGLRVGLDHSVLEARDRDRQVVASARLAEMSQLVVMGNVQVSTQALQELCEREIPIVWTSFGGWLCGFTEGLGNKNVELRRQQYRTAEDSEACLKLSRRIVAAKIANSRTMVRRNGEPDSRTLQGMADALDAAMVADSVETLLGIEGNAARLYFAAFGTMVKPALADNGFSFDFAKRNRRPPADPVNALLSLAYSMLTKELALTARSVGFDPYFGFYHRPRYGRPALALDLVEEFRPLVADSVVLTAINTGAVALDDFRRHALGVALTSEGRRRFLKVFERRLGEEITHPVFGYRVSYRRVLEVQVRLLARHLMGEIPEWPDFRTR